MTRLSPLVKRLTTLPRRALGAALDLVYPRVCEVCGRRLTPEESLMCLGCELDLPLTDYHLSDFNPIHQRLATTPPVERAASMFFYVRDDRYVRLIHNAKYNGRPEIIRELASRFTRMLLDTSGFFDGIDCVQPVPMHWWKELRRGYNQTDWLARGIAETAGIDIADVLTVVRSHSSQTLKNRFERWLNAKRSYGVTDTSSVAGRHVLLVDDVITTGSTLKACAEALMAAEPTVRISILSIAVTRLH